MRITISPVKMVRKSVWENIYIVAGRKGFKGDGKDEE